MTWLRQLFCLFLATLLAGCALAQTFQYSRGWTNGKRSGGPTACQLQRLRAILEGKPPQSDSSYVLCELYRGVPDDELRPEHFGKHPRASAADELVEK